MGEKAEHRGVKLWKLKNNLNIKLFQEALQLHFGTYLSVCADRNKQILCLQLVNAAVLEE